MWLLEELSDVWLKNFLQLCKLESMSLEVRVFFLCFWSRDIQINFLQLGQLCVYHCDLLLHLFKVLGELLYALGWTCMWLVIIIVFIILLRAMQGWMTLLVTLVTFLICPILFIIFIFSVLFFSLTFSSSSTTFLCEWGSIWFDGLGCSWFAVLVKQMEGLLPILGVPVVSGCKIILKICLEICVLFSTVTETNMTSIAPLHPYGLFCSAALRAANACWCTSCATYSRSTLCCQVTPITLATSTLVLKHS